MRGELLRLSRGRASGRPQDRPLPPPPPQKPIERPINYGVPYDFGGADARTGSSEAEHGIRCDSGLGNSQQNLSREPRQASSVAAAVAQRQHDLQQQQQERQHHLLREQHARHLPFPYGRAAGAPGVTHTHEPSPYTFDSEGAQGGFARFSRPQRLETSPVDGWSTVFGGPWGMKRQLQRVSPRHLPPAGVPSGGKREEEPGIGNRLRRQVLPSHAAELTSLVLPTSNHWQLRREHRNSLRQQGTSGHVGAPSASSGRPVPSTSPPSLHPEPGEPQSLVQQQRHVEQLSKGIVAAGLPSQGQRTEGGPPFGVWDMEQRPGRLLDEQRRQQSRQQVEGQRRTQSIRRQASFNGEVPAGKPSAENVRDTWGFRQSLRSSTERKTSAGKLPAVARNSSAPRSVTHNPSYASTCAFLSDDEETLRGLGVNVSPRELLFFRKQPALRGKQHRLHARSVRNCKAAATKETAAGWPARSCTIPGHESDRDATSPGERPNALRVKPPINAWSLPSWMRAYGSSDAPTRCPGRVGAANPFMSPMPAITYHGDLTQEPSPNTGGYAATAGWSSQSAPLCGCRCCRLRAAGGIPDQLCCCCPCCSAWSVGGPTLALPASYGGTDGTGNEAIATFGTPNEAADTKSKCSRCGKWSGGRSSAETAQPTAQSSACRRGLTLKEAASLCDACAIYLACERERNAQAVSRPSGAGTPSGETGATARPKLRLSRQRNGAVPAVSGGSPPSGSSPPADEASSSGEPSAGASPPAIPNPAGKVIDTRKLSQGELQQRSAAYPRASSLPLSKGLVQSGGSTGLELKAAALGSSPPAVLSERPPASNSVWESPRIVSKICFFLSLSKLLLVRRCNRALLQAAQFRMRYVLYKSLYVMLHQTEESPGKHPVVAEGYHCPLSAEALIKLLGLEPAEVEAIK